MFDIKGKVVVVTGAASGIGRALAEEAASRGAAIAVVDIDPAGADEVAAGVNAAGGNAQAFQVDITEPDALQALAAAVIERFGGVNVVFNNAGVFTDGRLERTKPADFDWLFDVNVRGMFNAVVAFTPALRETARAGQLAHFVNTGSELSLGNSPVGHFTAYMATKHAVFGLTDGLRHDLEGSGVGVTLVCPGGVQTAIWNAKRSRPERHGGPQIAPPEAAAILNGSRTSRATAETVFAGLDAGETLIVTDPRSSGFIRKRLETVSTALEVCKKRVGPIRTAT